MVFLMKGSTADLYQLVVEELGEESSEKATKIQLSKIIVVHADYEDVMMKELLEQVMSERKNSKKKMCKEAREHEIKLKELEI